jgi:hypothetical protein
MYGDWSREVRSEYVGGDVRYEFPVRPLGLGKLIGLVLIGFSILFVWSPAHTMWQTLQKWLHESTGSADKISAFFELPFILFGCIPMVIGLVILFGRCRVEWKEGRLRVTEIVGPFRWTRRLPPKPVRKLEVAASTTRSGTAPPRQFEQFSALVVVFEDDTKKLLVFGYPKDWLLGMAAELKGYGGGGGISTSVSRVEVVETSSLNENDGDVANQPIGSRVQVEDRVTGVRLIVPPAGLWRGSKGLFFFALMWCGFMTVFTTLMITSGLKTEGGSAVNVLFPILFVLGFWGIGIGLMAASINLGRRTATLEVGGGQLRIETKSLFGTKQWEWNREDLTAIRVDASSMEVNHRPVIQLQIHPRAGKKVGLLSGRDEDELRWMATRLRRALNVPARNS